MLKKQQKTDEIDKLILFLQHNIRQREMFKEMCFNDERIFNNLPEGSVDLIEKYDKPLLKKLLSRKRKELERMKYEEMQEKMLQIMRETAFPKLSEFEDTEYDVIPFLLNEGVVIGMYILADEKGIPIGRLVNSVLKEYIQKQEELKK